MLGTIVNAIAILVGGFIGVFIKEGLKERYKQIVMQGIPLAVLFIGASGTIARMLDPKAEPILFIISLVLGGLLGEWLNIEQKLENMGQFLQNKLGKGNSNISQGFVTASLLFCVGTMAILGSLESGLQNVHTTLFAKSVLDGITSIILASTLGVGVILSAGSILIYQGMITLLAQYIQPYMTEDMIREISLVGGILIFALGLTILDIKKIKVGNLLPAVLIPIVYYLPFVQGMIQKGLLLFAK